jgi:hypothetical protein
MKAEGRAAALHPRQPGLCKRTQQSAQFSHSSDLVITPPIGKLNLTDERRKHQARLRSNRRYRLKASGPKRIVLVIDIDTTERMLADTNWLLDGRSFDEAIDAWFADAIAPRKRN